LNLGVQVVLSSSSFQWLKKSDGVVNVDDESVVRNRIREKNKISENLLFWFFFYLFLILI
jgi:hypothetical protein